MSRSKKRKRRTQEGESIVRYIPDQTRLEELGAGIKYYAKLRVYLSYLFLLILLILAHPNPLFFLIGTVFIMAGSYQRIMSAATLVKAAKDGADALIMAGPYSKCRHPLYFGSFLNGIGFVFLAGPLGDLWPATRDMYFLTLPVGLFPWGLGPFIVILVPVYMKMIKIEEEFLGAKFGPIFGKYRALVPCFFPKPSFFKKDPEWQFDPARLKANREMKNFQWLMAAYVLFFAKMLYFLINDIRQFSAH
jgi:protein-S-isoprenylcysteine O-methyltransferase Ste14